MATRYKFFRTVWNDDLRHTIKGFPDVDFKDLLSGTDDISYKILPEEEYRPDLIAYKFYSDPTLSWVLIYANEFSNSPQDFVANTVINVPRFEKVVSLI